MSITGKGTVSIKKLDVQEQNTPAISFKKIRVLHEASAGDEIIDMTAPNAPSSATTYVEPSLSDRTATNLFQWKENVKVESTLRGSMMADIDYTINGAYRIRLNVPAEEAEIFEIVVDHNPRTGNSLVDAQPLVVTGVLAAGTQDFNVGTPFKVGEYLSFQHGAVMVLADGQLMYRNTGNNPPGAGVEGDYYEVPAGAGLAVVIRFNDTDTKDRNVSAISVGALVERPNGSQMALIEALQGQIDLIVPTLAQLAGVPETDFQGTPNDVDLKAFGDRVFQNEQDIETLESLISPKTKHQKKFLSADATIDGKLSDLEFSGLVIGKKYRIYGQAALQIDAGSGGDQIIEFYVQHNGGVIAKAELTNGNSIPTRRSKSAIMSFVFTATTTTVAGYASGATGQEKVLGNGTAGETWLEIEELNDYESTTDFS